MQELHFKAHGVVSESFQSKTEQRQGPHRPWLGCQELDSGWNTLVTLPPCGYGMTVPQKKESIDRSAVLLKSVKTDVSANNNFCKSA